MASGKPEGSSERRAYNLQWDHFDLVDTTIASDCRWKPGRMPPEEWQKHLESLATFGQLQEVLLAKISGSNRFHLLMGNNRLMGLREINENLPKWQAWVDEKIAAAQTLEEKKIYEKARARLSGPLPLSYKLREVDSAREAARMAEDENRIRQEMSPMDLAQAVRGRHLREEPHADIARDMGFSNPNRVSHLLSYFSLPEEAQEQLHLGTITETLAQRMVALQDLKKGGEVKRIVKAISEGKAKPSALVREAVSVQRSEGQRVTRTLFEFLRELEDLRARSPRACYLFDYIKSRPGMPDLFSILEEEELPEYQAEPVPEKKARPALSDEEKERRKAERKAKTEQKRAETKAQKDKEREEKKAKKEAEREAKKKEAKEKRQAEQLAKRAAAPKKGKKTAAPKSSAKKRKAAGKKKATPVREGEVLETDENGEAFISQDERDIFGELDVEAHDVLQALGHDRSRGAWNC